MAENTALPIKKEELEERLASAFEHCRGAGYFHMDCGGLYDPGWINTYDKLLNYFQKKQKERIEKQVRAVISLPGTHKIMDQGCGHANSLRALTRRFGKDFPESTFESYGVSGCLKDMWLGHSGLHYGISPEEGMTVRGHNIRPSESYGKSDSNVRFFGIEDDIHKTMKEFPFELDLVISDHTYFHLLAPWVALKHSADRLRVGGVALIRTIPEGQVEHMSQMPINDDTFLQFLRGDNPDYKITSSGRKDGHRVLAIVKTGASAFVTNLHMGMVCQDDRTYAKSFYARNPQRANLLSVDALA